MRRIIAFLLSTISVFGQDLALARLKQELKTAQDQDVSDQKRAQEILQKTGAWPDDMKGRGAARIARVHAALLSWIESQLPMGRSATAIKSSDWEAVVHRQLAAAGIAEKEPQDASDFEEKPDELIIELLDNSVDMGIHNRTQIHRYNFIDGVKRLEPVALQPQDFAEEWLTRPWSEMQSKSVPEAKKWHDKLHAELVLGEYSELVPCAAKPDRWSIGFDIDLIGENRLKEPIEVHLLVRDLGNYRFEMEAVRDSEFEGCAGEGSPSDKHPWLSVEQLKALP
jgi:hypothetical protein